MGKLGSELITDWVMQVTKSGMSSREGKVIRKVMKIK